MWGNFGELLAVEGECAIAAQGDDEGIRHLFECADGIVQIVAVGPGQCFIPVAEHQIDALANHLAQAVPEKFHHAGVGKAQRGAHAGGFGDLACFNRRGAASRRGDQIALDIQVFRCGDGVGIELLYRQGLTDTQVGIHAALCIRRDQHQALACDTRFPRTVQAVIHACRFQVGQVDIAVVVGGYLAGHECAPAKLGRGDHRVAGASAAGVICLDQVSLELCQQFALALLIDQGHQAFFDTHAGKLPILHLDLGVYQCCADAIRFVLLHAAVIHFFAEATHYPDSPHDGKHPTLA